MRTISDRINRSLTLKLFTGFLGISLAGIMLVALVIGLLLLQEFGRFIDPENQRQNSLANEVTAYYDANGWKNIAQKSGIDPTVTLDVSVAYVVGMDGTVHIPSGESMVNLDDLPWWQERTRVEREVVNGDGEQIATIIAFPVSAEFANRLQKTLGGGVVGAMLVSIMLARFGSKQLTQPVRELTQVANMMATGAEAPFIAVRSKDELGVLANAFNQMNREVTQSREMRRQLTADIAHDIRTPLGLIVGHTEALRDGVLPGDTETYQLIHEEALRINRLVEDLGTLSKAEAGMLNLRREKLSPQALLNRAMMAHTSIAEEKKVRLTMDIDDVLPDVSVDEGRIAQVLDNLISNALRYTHSGGHIQLSATQDDNNKVAISIQDDGNGISAKDLPFIFERFYRGDKSRNSNKGGSGLGLAIAKSIVEAHGGAITADSTVGRGSTFRIMLPAT